MREIKFRAWDKAEKKFWYFTLQEILERRMSYRGSWDEKVLVGEKTQYTGLKDKNGVEIYEGDIAQSIHDETYVSVVEYCTENLGSCGCCYDEFEGAGFKAKDLKVKECIVIGNIYENPELLEELQNGTK